LAEKRLHYRRPGLAVEVVGLDVGGDGGREQARAGVSEAEAASEFGRGDILVDGGEEVDACVLGGGEGKLGDLGIGEGELGAADNDPLGESEKAVGRTPAAKVEEAVGAGENEELSGRIFEGEGVEGVDGVVRGAIGTGGVEVGCDEISGWRLQGEGSGVPEGQASHFEPVGKGGDGAFGFEGLMGDGGEKNMIECEIIGRDGGQTQMATMDGIECAAEEGYAHSDHATAKAGRRRWGHSALCGDCTERA
jgi:hypothetical protein